MKKLLLPLAATLALSSCAESFAPHKTNPDLVGKTVRVHFGPDTYTQGKLLSDGRLESSGNPKSVNWDRALFVFRSR